ncbi:type II toxin-antitoxin system ParD family antitoxin [Rhizobium leguminosarum]|jgi:antitoxin ParD1/3/4|uniref:type II toxin-antitoxin system ParD family antitoxin n=1 Tax=Rhizobium leguminosarum TaxID=384 RepID=UPI003918A9FF
MTPQHAGLLRDAAGGGASQVIREVMRDWSAKWRQRGGDIEKLRGTWAEGRQANCLAQSISTRHLKRHGRNWRLARGHGG